MKFSSAIITGLLSTSAAAMPAVEATSDVLQPIDYVGLTETFQKRALETHKLEKRCDHDFFETCMGTCNNPSCPACNLGCVIGCCGSTHCC